MVLVYFLAIVVLINCIYFLLFSKLSFFKSSEESTNQTFAVSLIVCAKNEAQNLAENIPIWLKQDHPNFEIVLINDASIDESLDVMESFAHTDSRIQIVNVENNEAFWANKKYALTLGIKKAKNKRMVFTDADCKPSSPNWLTILTSHFSTEKQLILGYGPYEKNPGLLNALIRFETLMTATQYLSYAKRGLPYMGVGRNLSYTSSLYYEHNGFTSHIKVASGDDDLFVNQAATSTNTEICINPNAFTYSKPKTNWKSWFHQKKRHISTAKFYKSQHKTLLAGYYIANLLFWILAPIAFIFFDWRLVLPIVGLRMTVQYIILGMAASKLNEKNLIPFLPILELFLVFTQLSIFISNRISKPTRWK